MSCLIASSPSGVVYWNGLSNTNVNSSTIPLGAVIGCAVDWDAGEYSWYQDGVLLTTETINGNPSGLVPMISDYNGEFFNTIINFGQQPFAAPNVTHNIDAGTVVIDSVT